MNPSGKRPIPAGVTGVILYEGPSVLDGAPIVVIATLRTANEKTGDLIQTWIMRSDIHPIDANASGEDESVCGTCPHRGISGKKRSCYVNLLFGPNNIYKAYKSGKYHTYTLDYAPIFENRLMRAGSYGDPVAVPHYVWEDLNAYTFSTTSYTHLWRLAVAAPFRGWTVASVDTLTDRKHAKGLGWRTYRVDHGEGLQPGEVWCPASEAGNHRAQCAQCMACDGHARGSKRMDFAIPAHGRGASHFDQWSTAREFEQQGYAQLEIW